MEVQWYPGQMAKARRLLKEHLRLVDAVIEVLDARVPASSRNPDLRKILSTRPLPVVAALNKEDLADPAATLAWEAALKNEYFAVVPINAQDGSGIEKLLRCLQSVPRREKTGQRPLRVMVAGIPNVGKSSLINRLTGRSAASTGNRPGITKGKQWIRIRDGLELLDTPGLLWPKITSEKQAFGLAAVGSIKDEVFDQFKLAEELAAFLCRHAPGTLAKRYGLKADDLDAGEIVAEIGRRRGCLQKGGIVDLETAARILIKDFRDGRLGRITLESADDPEEETPDGFSENDGEGH